MHKMKPGTTRTVKKKLKEQLKTLLQVTIYFQFLWDVLAMVNQTFFDNTMCWPKMGKRVVLTESVQSISKLYKDKLLILNAARVLFVSF